MKDVNLDYLKKAYFYFDLPVPYELSRGEVLIRPISLKDSELFLSSMDIINIDKNAISDPKVISMSYLEFIVCHLIMNQGIDEETRFSYLQKLIVIWNLCLGLNALEIRWKKIGKPYLHDSIANIDVKPKEFDAIRKIILYQNLINYDDSYINPDLKKAMDEVDKARNANLEVPDLERRMAIITAHSGVSKKDQIEMTYRSHNLLFEEVCGEVDFTTIRPVALFSGNADKVDHWIFKKKKDKFEGYFSSVDSYAKKFGINEVATSTDNAIGDAYAQNL